MQCFILEIATLERGNKYATRISILSREGHMESVR